MKQLDPRDRHLVYVNGAQYILYIRTLIIFIFIILPRMRFNNILAEITGKQLF